MFSRRTKAWINFTTNVCLAGLGSIAAAGIAKGDTWAVVAQPYVLIGVAIAVLGVLRATVNDDPKDPGLGQ